MLMAVSINFNIIFKVILVILRMINLKEMVYFTILMEMYMKENGNKINGKVREIQDSQMVLNILEIIQIIIWMEMANFGIKMGMNILEKLNKGN